METRAGPYRRYRQILVLYPIVLCIYAGIAWSDWWSPRHVSGEIFPFFSWDLFSSPWQHGRLYTVRVTAVVDEQAPATELVGRTLNDPREVDFLRDPRFQKAARSLALAYWAKEEKNVERLAVQLGNFLRPQGIVEYDLIYLSYHPLRYYRGEEVPEETQIARFRLAAPP
jgi:hypothetical protein